MSELCKYDEQVLDYLYGELAPPERATFAEHLAGCESCRREIDSLSGVRKKAAELPRPVLAPDAAAKMTAQLMEAAIAAIAATKTKASPAPMGGGKIVPFPSGRVRRVLTHPTTAALTIAAAALFLLVIKDKDPAVPVSDSPATAQAVAVAKQKEAAPLPPVVAPGTASTQVPVLETVTEAKPGAGDSQPPPPKPEPKQAGPQKTGFFEGRFSDSTTRARSLAPVAGTSAEPAKKLAWVAPQASPPAAPMAAPTATPTVAKPTANYELATNERKASAKREELDDSRFAQPPPPAAYGAAPTTVPARARDEEAAPTGVVAQSKARQQQRTMDELERAELAQAPVPGDGYRRNALADSAGSVGNLASGSGGGAKDVQSDDDVASSLGKRAPAADKVAEKADKAAEPSGPLNQVYEQIRSGRCVEARDLLHKLERSQPGLQGLSDANTAWQKDCGVRMQLQNLQPQMNQQVVQPQGLPSRSNYAPSMPSPAAPRMEKMKLESQQGLGNSNQQGGYEMRRAAMKKPAPPSAVQKAPAKAKASKAAAADLAL